MFTLKIFNSTLISTRLSIRSISNGSPRLLGLFSKDKPVEEPEESMIFDEEIVDPEIERERINKIRDKSRLNTSHRRMLHGEVPYDVAHSWVHNTLKYQRKMYGKYGSQSNLDPRICFWSKTEIAEMKEYEQKAYPKSIQEMLANVQAAKKEANDKAWKKEQEIIKNLAKLDQWIKDIDAKKQKKEEDALQARARKDRLIEEVRREFGFALDPRDERFKEMVALKEKEQKKALKEQKKKEKESKLIAKLVEITAAQKTQTDLEGDESPENAAMVEKEEMEELEKQKKK